MDKKQYIKKVLRDLTKNENKNPPQTGRLDFKKLKILEFWVRFMDCDQNLLNISIAFRLMEESYRAKTVESVVGIFDPYIKPVKKCAKGPDRNEVDEDFREIEDLMIESDIQVPDELSVDDTLGAEEYDYDMTFCNGGFLRQIGRYKKELKFGNHKQVQENLIREISGLSPDSMAPFLYKELLNVICENFKDYALAMFRRGISDKDKVYDFAQKVKETYRLKDDDMEILLYLWLRNTDNLHLDLDEEFGYRRRRFGRMPNEIEDVAKEIATATGFKEIQVKKLLGRDSTLQKLGLFNDDFDVPYELGSYLDGYSSSMGLKAFHLADAGTVPFDQLKVNNPDAEFALSLIKNHGWDCPLNMLFYGIEGAGKTELAKALAREAGLPLLEISIDAGNMVEFGRRVESRTQSLMLFRIRAAMLANWQCEQEHGIIMIDEADLVLNGFEKGSLNTFFESVHTPIIWITNSLRFTEGSTRRRFDFSIQFKGLMKDERLNMFNSVLKAQGAENLLSEAEKMRLVVEYPVMAGGFTLATRRTCDLMAKDSGTSAYATMSRLLKAHTNLLGISGGSLRELDCHAPSYSLEGLNMEGSAAEVMEVVRNFDEVWRGMEESSSPNSLNILLYGPPGTGKTEFVRHIARTLGRNLIVRRASDLLGMYVGQTEAQIAAAFDEAERTKSILFFDEADSFLRDRAGAMQGHEVTKVNEILTRMENFKGIFIAATNFESSLDVASRRRFALKLGFGYLKPEGVRQIWNVFFPMVECPNAVSDLPMLTPGDFNAVSGRLRYLPESSRTAERIEAELRKELQAKDSHAGRTMGF